MQKVLGRFWIPLCLLCMGCQLSRYDEFQNYPTFTFAAGSEIAAALEIVDEYFKSRDFKKAWFEGYIHKERYIGYKVEVISIEPMTHCSNRIEACEAIRLIPRYSFEKRMQLNSADSAQTWNDRVWQE